MEWFDPACMATPMQVMKPDMIREIRRPQRSAIGDACAQLGKSLVALDTLRSGGGENIRQDTQRSTRPAGLRQLVENQHQDRAMFEAAVFEINVLFSFRVAESFLSIP